MKTSRRQSTVIRRCQLVAGDLISADLIAYIYARGDKDNELFMHDHQE